MTDKTVLLDGDVLFYKALFAAEEALDIDGELNLSVNMDKATALYHNLVANIMDLIPGGADLIVAISDEKNFRKELYPDYKKNRTSHRKPIGLPALKRFVRDNYTTATKERLEADDTLGILATSDLIQGRTLIVSTDKDLRQVPGNHFNPDKPEEGVRLVSEAQGVLQHMMQTLMGDSTDCYPGCPGVGIVGALKVLGSDGDVITAAWPRVVLAYEKKGLTADDALLQARLAKILTSELYDFKNKEHRLWTPA
ncbi:MAG: hypothetical protein GEU78_10340 [Actinobacteria bacterium]|nr:hypothetical protein [Actinomycetota bacterium]